jgi:hypothetical protein
MFSYGTDEVKFRDKFGEVRKLRKTRHGFQLQRNESTVALRLCNAIAKHVGRRIREERVKQKLELAELCIMAGLKTATPKGRMFEIERGKRGMGIKLGTLYAIAHALKVAPASLLPSMDEALSTASVEVAMVQALEVAE